MYRTLILATCFLGVALYSSSAQDGKKENTKKEAPTTPGVAVDVQFRNGSNVRLQIQTEKLEIETPYGKLAVPISQVRAIEFGAHLPDGHAAKIDAAIKALSHANFVMREKAAAALVDLGPHSYGAVLNASKSKEADLAARAKTVLQKLQAKYSKKDLIVTADDRVVTPTFPIVGRILTPSLKVKADYFGDQQLNLADMRSMRGVGAPVPEVSVSVDASKYASRDRSQWLATTFEVDGRSPIVITASGQIDLWPENGGQFLFGPNGARANFGGLKKVASKTLQGVLVGKIGESGETFVIGDRYEGTPSQAGKLYLQINPSTYSNSSVGSYEVRAKRQE